MEMWQSFHKELGGNKCNWTHAPDNIQVLAELFLHNPVESYGLHVSAAYGDYWHGNLGLYMRACEDLAYNYEDALAYAACPAWIDHQIAQIDQEWYLTVGMHPWEIKVRTELKKGVLIDKLMKDAEAREALEDASEYAAIIILVVAIGILLLD